jgi:hypothetical protein
MAGEQGRNDDFAGSAAVEGCNAHGKEAGGGL